MKILAVLCLLFGTFSLQAHLSIDNATVRLLPPTVPNTSAYFIITNDTYGDIRLVGGHTDIADKLELHTHIMDGEIMRMRRVEEVLVTAQSTVSFSPGGFHVMLFGLKTPLKKGQHVPITLVTKSGLDIPFIATVTFPGQNAHSHH